MMRSLSALALAALLIPRAPVSAQGMINGPKTAAKNAAAATNAHTTAEQSPTATATTTPATTTPVATTTAKTTPAAPAMAPLPPRFTRTTTSIAATAKPTTAVPAAKVTPAPASATAIKITPKTTAKLTAASAAPATTSDTGSRSISVTQRGMKGEVSLEREVFSYDAGGRRDPFVSLLRNGDLRPMLNDLRLVTVIYDPTGRNSIAIMRDVSTKDQYRVRVGTTLGRMRVAQIEPREIVFTIEEIGFSRQELLALGDSSTARTQ